MRIPFQNLAQDFNKGLQSMLVVLMSVNILACTAIPHIHENLFPKPAGQIRVVTYNINFGDGVWTVDEPYKTLHAIQSSEADLVFLQELNPVWARYFKHNLIKQYPYQIYTKDEDAGAYGVLSHYPISPKGLVSAGIGWHPTFLLDVHTPKGIIQVANVHLTPPLVSKSNLHCNPAVLFSTPYTRQKEISYYLSLLRKDTPTLIIGDFNEGNQGFAVNYLTKHGFVDAQIARNTYFTTWEWRFGFLKLQDRLDHVFYNHWFKATKTQLLHDGDSDHFPLAVDLTWNTH